HATEHRTSSSKAEGQSFSKRYKDYVDKVHLRDLASTSPCCSWCSRRLPKCPTVDTASRRDRRFYDSRGRLHRARNRAVLPHQAGSVGLAPGADSPDPP